MRAPLTVALLAACAAIALPAAAQTAAKPAAEKKPAAKAKAPAGRNTKLSRGAQKAVEENTPIDDDPSIQIGEKELAVAREVQTGDMPCELGASVKVTPSKREGLFLVTTKGYRFLMHPVDSRTGAIRLEDARRGAMWLQLGNKSMLMSQKLGQRLADECQSPKQAAFAEELKRNPRPSILDAPAPAASAPAAASSTSAAAASAPAAAASASTPPASAPAAGTAPATNPAVPAAAAPASAPRAN